MRKGMELLKCTLCGNSKVEVYTNGLSQMNFNCECGSVTQVDICTVFYLDPEREGSEDGVMQNKYTKG